MQRNDLCSCCLLMPEFPACLYSLLYWLLDHLYNSRHGQRETARRQSLLQVLLRTTVLVALPKNRALSDQSTLGQSPKNAAAAGGGGSSLRPQVATARGPQQCQHASETKGQQLVAGLAKLLGCCEPHGS
jgi:hypothetical protein